MLLIGGEVVISISDGGVPRAPVERVWGVGAPSQEPNVGRARRSGAGGVVDPAGHLPGGSEDVADEGHPIGVTDRAGATLDAIGVGPG